MYEEYAYIKIWNRKLLKLKTKTWDEKKIVSIVYQI